MSDLTDVLMTGDEVRAAKMQAAISSRSDLTRHHSDVVIICDDWLYLTRENEKLRARLRRAEAALKRIADYVPAVRSGDAGEMARIALGAAAGEEQSDG